MSENKLKAKVRVYSIQDEDFLLYKFKGKFYPISLSKEDDSEVEPHVEPSPYYAALVAQNQFAPIFSKQIKMLGLRKKKPKLEAIYTF